MTTRTQRTPQGILLGLFVILALAPFGVSEFNLRLANLALHTAIAVVGLCIAFGWAGLLHLGQAAFIGLGAYITAILATRYGLAFWITMPIALIASGLAALIIAIPVLRLRGHYLALATLGFSVTVEIVIRNWTSLTGGFDGIGSIPVVSIFGHELHSDTEYYYLSLAFLIVVCLFTLALRHSRYGRAMIAIRDDELAAGTSGINITQTKVLAFVLASVLAALSGVLFAHHARYISPQDFELVRSITILVMLILGGETSIIGSVIGAIILTYAPEWLRFLGDAYLAVFGLGILLILILLPGGIMGQITQRLPNLTGKARSHG